MMVSLQSKRKCEDVGQRLFHLEKQYQELQMKANEIDTRAACTARAMEEQLQEKARLLDILKGLGIPQAAINGHIPPDLDNAGARRKAKEYVAEVLAFVAHAYGGTEEAGTLEERMGEGEGSMSGNEDDLPHKCNRKCLMCNLVVECGQ